MYSQMPISKDLPSCNTTLLFATFQNGTEAGEQCMTNLIVERSFISFHHIYWNKSALQWWSSATFVVRK